MYEFESSKELVREHKQVVKLEDINLTYQQGAKEHNILSNINLDLYKDDFICVLGPSGCGKTSLLNAIAGYNYDITGSVYVNDKIHDKPNTDVGVVFQQPNLFPWLSVERNVEFGLKMKRLLKAERKDIVNKYLKIVELEHAAKLLPHELSGGMKQRAAIARTLAADSQIVLLDEPFSALDAMTREVMQKHLLRIWKSSEKCFFFITHDVEEALLLSSRLIVMSARPGEISVDMENPLHKYSGKDFNEIKALKEFSELREKLLENIQENSRNI